MHFSFFKRLLVAAGLAAIAFTTASPAAHAANSLSRASAESALSVGVPVAVSVAGIGAVLSDGVSLAVASVETSAEGATWVLAKASDGTGAALRLSFAAGEATLVAVGTAVNITAVSAGWLLSEAGKVLAFVPNALGESLTHNERLTD